MTNGEPAKGQPNVERKGPLAELPSKPDLRVGQIKAPGDNQWLKLPDTEPDPLR